MKRKGWYLVAYDIACPRRLSRIHRLIRSEGITVQKSVFLINGTQQEMGALLDRLAVHMHLREDDLKAYPIKTPADLWTAGPNPLSGLPLVYLGQIP